MRRYTLLSRLGIGKLGVMLANYLLHFFLLFSEGWHLQSNTDICHRSPEALVCYDYPSYSDHLHDVVCPDDVPDSMRVSTGVGNEHNISSGKLI